MCCLGRYVDINCSYARSWEHVAIAFFEFEVQVDSQNRFSVAA